MSNVSMPIPISKASTADQSSNENELELDDDECSVCEMDPFVKIDLILVDEKGPEFGTKFKFINRFINIKFSRLKLTVNPETWILVLDLLGNLSFI